MRNKPITISVVVAFALAGIICGGRGWYISHKRAKAKESAVVMLQKFEARLAATKQAAESTGFAFVEAERTVMAGQQAELEGKGREIGAHIVALLADAKTDLRVAFEPGMNPDPAYLCPQVQLDAVTGALDGLADAYRGRLSLRNEVVLNEFTLRCRLKKPRPTNEVELPPELAEVAHASTLVSLIPTVADRPRLESLNDPALVNNLGMCLLQAQPVLKDLETIGREQRVLDHARSLYATAVARLSQVESLNDAMPTWYSPGRDDGHFDQEAYTTIKAQQQPAMQALRDGDNALSQLRSYNTQVRSQVVQWVSGNPTQTTSNHHTRRVWTGRRDKDGDKIYTRETYYTPGMIFYVERSTNRGSGITTERTKVGEKDSDDYVAGSWGSAWSTWNYGPTESVGYLIEYKGFGLDPASTVRGGRFDASIHRMLDPSQVPADAVSRRTP